MNAVIGAAPMGLAGASNLGKYGIRFFGLEPNTEVGGSRGKEIPCSAMYETAHLTSLKSMTHFSQLDLPKFAGVSQVCLRVFDPRCDNLLTMGTADAVGPGTAGHDEPAARPRSCNVELAGRGAA